MFAATPDLNNLPQEMKLQIASNLSHDLKSLVSLGSTNQSWRAIMGKVLVELTVPFLINKVDKIIGDMNNNISLIVKERINRDDHRLEQVKRQKKNDLFTELNALKADYKKFKRDMQQAMQIVKSLNKIDAIPQDLKKKFLVLNKTDLNDIIPPELLLKETDYFDQVSVLRNYEIRESWQEADYFDQNSVINNYQRGRHWQGVDFNITPEQVYTLLANSANRSGELGRKAKDLLNTMSETSWTITAGGHAGGLGGGVHAADPNPHLTVRVGRTTYHIQYQIKNKNMILIDITS